MYFFTILQTLPIVPKGTVADTLSATLKNSYLWDEVKSFKLVQNMRLKGADDRVKSFANYLIKIGRGEIEPNTDIGQDMIEIPVEFKSKAQNLEQFCDEIFPGKHFEFYIFTLQINSFFNNLGNCLV